MPAWLWLVALAVASQLIVIQVIGRDGQGERFLPVLLPASHLLLIPFLLKNRSLLGFRLVFLGLLLNLAVMLTNGGLMPVAPDAVQTVARQDANALQLGEHIPGTKNVYLLPQDTRLGELSDVIILPLPHPYTKAVSAGDLLILPGIAIALAEIMLRASRGGRRA